MSVRARGYQTGMSPARMSDMTTDTSHGSAGHPSTHEDAADLGAVPLRDGHPYDLEYRTKLMRQAVADALVKQPRGVHRPDGPHGYMIAVNAISGRQSPVEFFSTLRETYPQLAYFHTRGEHTYVLTDADLIQEVFQGRGKDLVKGRALQQAKAVVGEGLLTSEGEQHMRQRRMIQPAFHHERIAEYAQQMSEAAVAHSDGWRDGQHVEMAADMSALTLDVVGRTLFGTDLTGSAREVGESLNEVLEAFPRMMLPGGQFISRLPLPSNKRLEESINRLDLLIQRIIAEHRANGDNGDLLSMMIAAQEDGFSMDDAQLRDEVMTLVLAGHETTAMTLTWTWYLLSQNLDIATALHAEVDSVLGGRPAEFADIPNLPFTHATISEAIRLFPPAWIIGRRTLTDMEIAGFEVPAGSILLASQMGTHRDPRYWQDAEQFTPRRWIDESGAFSEKAPGQPRGAWFPFAFGKRRCIGDQFAWTEAIIVLATLAQQWSPELDASAAIEPVGAVTLRPKGGMPMTVRRRRDA